jgi:hypothetical protein
LLASIFSNGIASAAVATGAEPVAKYSYTPTGHYDQAKDQSKQERFQAVSPESKDQRSGGSVPVLKGQRELLNFG